MEASHDLTPVAPRRTLAKRGLLWIGARLQSKDRPGERDMTATQEAIIDRARAIAETVLRPAPWGNDREGRFSTEAIDALGSAGLLPLRCRPKSAARDWGHAHSRTSSRSAPRPMLGMELF